MFFRMFGYVLICFCTFCYSFFVFLCVFYVVFCICLKCFERWRMAGHYVDQEASFIR